MSKHQMFMEQIVCKYHPEFRKSKDLQKYGLKYPEIFNIERLIEESLAAVGGYDFVDEAGRDFNCPSNSDSKTVTVVNNGGHRQAKVMVIGSVENKIGSLRVTIYNPWKQGVDYMYIPKKNVQLLMENSGTAGNDSGFKQRIRGTWNPERDDYNKLECFRVSSFKELALATG
jgi:hypothetical protein